MDFFEKLGKKATETFNSAAEKTNKLAGEAKFRIKINDCKSKIKDIYQDIGKIVYQKFVLEGKLEVKEDIQEQLLKIKEYTDQIEEYEKQILELTNLKQCENCKNKIDKNAKFCPECGTEQPIVEVQEAEVLEDEQDVEEEEKEVVVEDIEDIENIDDVEEDNKGEE